VAENLKLCQFLLRKKDPCSGRWATRVRDHKTGSKQPTFITWETEDYELIMDYVKHMHVAWNADEKKKAEEELRKTMLAVKLPTSDKLQHEVSEKVNNSEPLLTNSKGKMIKNHSKERHEFVKCHPYEGLSSTSVRKCTETIVAQDSEVQEHQNSVSSLLAHTPGVARSHYTRIACSEMNRAMDLVGDALKRYGTSRCNSSIVSDDGQSDSRCSSSVSQKSQNHGIQYLKVKTMLRAE